MNLLISNNLQLNLIKQHYHTRKLSITEEGLDVIFRKAVVLEHSIKPLKVLNVMLEGDLLLPTTCSVKAFRKKQTQHCDRVKLSQLQSFSRDSGRT